MYVLPPWLHKGESKSITKKDRENGSAFLSSVLVRLALHWPLAGTRDAALMLCHRLVKDNEMAATMTMQHVIAPPLPPLDSPEDEEWMPAVPWGTVLLEELGVSLRSDLAQKDGSATECAQVACFLLEHILVQGGLSAKEIATRIPAPVDLKKGRSNVVSNVSI